MFGSLCEKMKSAFWSNRSRLEKFFFIIMGFFVLVIIVLSSLVAAHYQKSFVNTDSDYSYKKFYLNEPITHSNRSSLSTHILDVSRGLPASNVEVTLSVLGDNNQYQRILMKRTNLNGRIDDLLGTIPMVLGTYKIQFETENYYRAFNLETFYPSVEVIFNVKDISQFYHIPLTLSPYGYSTYRGS